MFYVSQMKGKIDLLAGVINTEFIRKVKTPLMLENPYALDDNWKKIQQFRFPVLNEAPDMNLKLLTRDEFVKWYPKNEFSEEFLGFSMKMEKDGLNSMHLYMYLEEHAASELVCPVE